MTQGADPHEGPPRASALRLLVVDDHPFQRRAVLRMLLRLGGVEATEAADGASALERLRRAEEPVDVVVTDLDMPGMDGIEFLRHLGALARPPAVILASAVHASVLASVQTMAQAYGVHLLAVAAKPLTEEILRQALAAHAQRPPAATPAQGPAPADVQEIRAALAAQRFEAFFQPKVDMHSLRVVGFEALARWRRGDGELIGPASFLPVMEREGCVDDLTWSMLQQGARFAVGLRQRGSPATVSVNLSAVSLGDPGLAGKILESVQAVGARPPEIVLEITESAAVGAQIGPMLENLNRLRVRGFGLSIDDCGTGYASFEQLARVPFTELKVDQSFVRSAHKQHASMVLLQASLEIARKLSLVSVAEGVESRAEWQLLQHLGCDVAQGFGIARPMPADAAWRWHEDWQHAPRWP